MSAMGWSLISMPKSKFQSLKVLVQHRPVKSGFSAVRIKERPLVHQKPVGTNLDVSVHFVVCSEVRDAKVTPLGITSPSNAGKAFNPKAFKFPDAVPLIPMLGGSSPLTGLDRGP